MSRNLHGVFGNAVTILNVAQGAVLVGLNEVLNGQKHLEKHSSKFTAQSPSTSKTVRTLDSSLTINSKLCFGCLTTCLGPEPGANLIS